MQILNRTLLNSNRQFFTDGTKTSGPFNKKPVSILRKKIVVSKGSNDLVRNLHNDNRLSVTIAETMITKSSNKKGRIKNKIGLGKDWEKTDVEVVEKKINSDGSKDWYTFREGGKYGSHPSFDSMDDESLP